MGFRRIPPTLRSPQSQRRRKRSLAEVMATQTEEASVKQQLWWLNYGQTLVRVWCVERRQEGGRLWSLRRSGEWVWIPGELWIHPWDGQCRWWWWLSSSSSSFMIIIIIIIRPHGELHEMVSTSLFLSSCSSSVSLQLSPPRPSSSSWSSPSPPFQIFKTKYKTECSKTYSTQCQTSYKTECTTRLHELLRSSTVTI